MTHGLVIVNTGDGKGKTTAALGLALRAWGDGLRVLILQFLKSNRTTGEKSAIGMIREQFGGIELRSCGLGFTNRKGDHEEAAKAALCEAKTAIKCGVWDMVILDEINYAVRAGLLTDEDIRHLLDLRPENLHLVFTGRGIPDVLRERADLITEMQCLRHPYEKGITAQKGIEY